MVSLWPYYNSWDFKLTKKLRGFAKLEGRGPRLHKRVGLLDESEREREISLSVKDLV